MNADQQELLGSNNLGNMGALASVHGLKHVRSALYAWSLRRCRSFGAPGSPAGGKLAVRGSGCTKARRRKRLRHQYGRRDHPPPTAGDGPAPRTAAQPVRNLRVGMIVSTRVGQSGNAPEPQFVATSPGGIFSSRWWAVVSVFFASIDHYILGRPLLGHIFLSTSGRGARQLIRRAPRIGSGRNGSLR